MADTKKPSVLDSQIDANLRKVYQKTLEEDVPDRFTELLERLKAQEAQEAPK